MQKIPSFYKSTKYLLPFDNSDGNNIAESFKPLNEDWKEAKISVKYLSKFVGELFHADGSGICKKYYLSEEAYGKYGLPDKHTDIKLTSDMPAVKGEFFFKISKIEQFIFNTGLGFLEIEVTYPGVPLEYISDVSYCIANTLNNEHDNDIKKENRINYSVDSGDHLFSLKNAIHRLLNVADGKVELFPNSTRKRMFVFHNLIQNEPEIDKSILESLKKVLPSSSYDSTDTEGVDFSVSGSQLWGISSNGVVSVALENDSNRDFLYNTYRHNVYNDYFSTYILALYEREILLKYNHLAVKNHAAPKMLMALKPEILRLEILFSYNTVSTEVNYQEFYEHVYDVFKLANLESDISGILDKVDEYVKDRNDQKINVILSAVALLAVISVICDALTVADRFTGGYPFGIPHIVLLIFITLVIGVSVFLSLHKKK